MREADLHIHTNYSDSTSTPDEVIEQARANNLACIAITDHDTIDGIAPAMTAAEPYAIEVVSGIELSTELNKKDVHILGYLFDRENKSFVSQIRRMQVARLERMREMIQKLKQLGIDDITFDDVNVLAASDSLGRPHLAKILLEKGWVSSIQMAFNKYLADDAPAYVPKFKQSPAEAINLIRNAGGIAVLAHPMLTQVDEHIPGLVEAGLGGIEVYYPNVTRAVIQFYEQMAEKHRLVKTGGSDAHGDVKKHTYIGKIKIPYSLIDQLKNACLAQKS